MDEGEAVRVEASALASVGDEQEVNEEDACQDEDGLELEIFEDVDESVFGFPAVEAVEYLHEDEDVEHYC